jgi:hypothetical protein
MVFSILKIALTKRYKNIEVILLAYSNAYVVT